MKSQLISKETTIIYNLSECKFLYNGLYYLPDRLISAFWPRWLAGLEIISKYYSPEHSKRQTRVNN